MMNDTRLERVATLTGAADKIRELMQTLPQAERAGAEKAYYVVIDEAQRIADSYVADHYV